MALASILVPSIKQSSIGIWYLFNIAEVILVKISSKCLTTTLLRNLERVTYEGVSWLLMYKNLKSNFKLSSIFLKLPECLEKAYMIEANNL